MLKNEAYVVAIRNKISTSKPYLFALSRRPMRDYITILEIQATEYIMPTSSPIGAATRALRAPQCKKASSQVTQPLWPRMLDLGITKGPVQPEQTDCKRKRKPLLADCQNYKEELVFLIDCFDLRLFSKRGTFYASKVFKTQAASYPMRLQTGRAREGCRHGASYVVTSVKWKAAMGYDPNGQCCRCVKYPI